MQMSENGLELLKQWEGFKLAVYEGPVIGGR
jgi:GH24 family phage-related lysozyme (muramidase)